VASGYPWTISRLEQSLSPLWLIATTSWSISIVESYCTYVRSTLPYEYIINPVQLGFWHYDPDHSTILSLQLIILILKMDCKPAITTVSLGSCEFHSITDKIDEAARNGFKAIELFIDDLEALAKDISPTPANSAPSRDSVLAAARRIRQQCDRLNIVILNLQPLRFYEGLVDRKKRNQILDEVLPIWMDALTILGADTILVPSNFLPEDPATGLPQTVRDVDIIVEDLRELAARGAQHESSIKFAYEALAWGTHVNTWEKSWEIVQAVNRPNFGLALDTFNIAGAVYADPTTKDGRVADTAETDLTASLGRMASTLDISKLFIVQIADAERLSEPLHPGHPLYVESQPSRLSWSRNCRLFLCESDRGGFLPVLSILKAILDLGWTGYLAYEVFSRSLADNDHRTPARHAERAKRSWQRLCDIAESKRDQRDQSKSPARSKSPAAGGFELPGMGFLETVVHEVEKGVDVGLSLGGIVI
jgi:4-hydroxyphenylpyruvate dioxygenase